LQAGISLEVIKDITLSLYP